VCFVSEGVLVETIAAAILDGITVTFSPADHEGTGLPTGVIVGVHHERGGRMLGSAREVEFGELSLSGAAEDVLTNAVEQTLLPVLDAALMYPDALTDSESSGFVDLLQPDEHLTQPERRGLRHVLVDRRPQAGDQGAVTHGMVQRADWFGERPGPRQALR